MPVPVVDFTANITSGNTPLTVNFTDQSTNTPIFWYWDFGDGAVSESQNPTHVYNNPGVYTVTLTASNTTGSATTTKVNYINVTVPVAANANIVLVPTLSAMTYASSYLAAYPTAIEVGGTFDTSQVGTGITFTTDTNVVIDTTYTNIFGQIFGAATAIGTTHTAYGNIYVAEFRIIAVGKTNFVQVGMFIQAYGPLFDPNTQFGGPLSSYYSSTGIIYGYGSGATVNADTYTDGDVIGMVMGVGFGQIAFFKNGVLQTELANMSNSDGYVMAGT
jgi:PKD repeat protein